MVAAEGQVGKRAVGGRRLPPGQTARADFPRFGTHLHYRPPAAPADPVIEISGAIAEPLTVHWRRLELARRAQTSDFHCISGWSATDLRWEGIPFAAFYREILEPRLASAAEVTHLVFEGLDGYRIAVCIEDALAEDVLLADRLDGKPLDGDHGAPIRVVSPGQYGYVSAKHLSRIELHTAEPKENYSYVHPLGRVVMHPPLFWRHRRGRVWHEERNRHLPARLLRVVYPPLRAPIRWLSARGSGSAQSPEPR